MSFELVPLINITGLVLVDLAGSKTGYIITQVLTFIIMIPDFFCSSILDYSIPSLK